MGKFGQRDEEETYNSSIVQFCTVGPLRIHLKVAWTWCECIKHLHGSILPRLCILHRYVNENWPWSFYKRALWFGSAAIPCTALSLQLSSLYLFWSAYLTHMHNLSFVFLNRLQALSLYQLYSLVTTLKKIVHSYQRPFFHLLKVFTGVALLIPDSHITNFGGTLVSAALVESFQSGRHDDQTVSTLWIQCAILLWLIG